MKALVDRLANQNRASAHTQLPVPAQPPATAEAKETAAPAKKRVEPRFNFERPRERAEKVAHMLIAALFGEKEANLLHRRELDAQKKDPFREDRALLRAVHIDDGVDQEMIVAMSRVFRVNVQWMVREYGAFKRPVRPVRVIHPHTNVDVEAACMAWLLIRRPELRSRFNIAPDVHVECVKSGALTEDGATPSLEGLPKAFLKSAHLEQFGHLFVDCGGGGGMLDQHGRGENRSRNTVSSLHLLIAASLDHIPALVHLVPLFEQVIDNDLHAERLAKGYNIRDFLNGLMAMELSSEECLDYLFAAFDAAESFLLAKRDDIVEDDARAVDRFREVRTQVLAMENILAHLEPPTEADLRSEAAAEVRCILAEAARGGMPMPAGEEEQLKALSLQGARERASGIAAFQDRFRAIVEEAKAARNAAWEQASRDADDCEQWSLAAGKAVLFSSQVTSIAGRPFHGYLGRVDVIVAESSSASFGPHCRWRHSKKMRTELARSMVQSERIDFQTARAAAQAYNPGLISVQLRDVTRGPDGAVASYRFTIAGSGIDLTQVAAEIRKRHARWLNQQGATAINDCGIQAKSMTARQKGAAEAVAIDYLPEFRTVYGNWFKTNQEMPVWTLPLPIVYEAIEVGMAKSAEVTEARLREHGWRPKRLIAPVYEELDNLGANRRPARPGSSPPAAQHRK